jgi:serine phosphatase RsbU (regulator of sigma subunit)/CHASE2 domain-containing sensor protein
MPAMMSGLRRGRVVGVVVLVVMVAGMVVPGVTGRELLRYAWFDALQRVLPRERVSGPVVIVDVDGKSLARYGQWPWPRTLLARLIERVLAGDAAAVGLDIVMAEPDRLSPQYLPKLIPSIDRELAARLAELPSNDTVLATTIRDRPVVLGVAGVNGGTGETVQRAPARAAPLRAVGGDPATYLWRYEGMVRSIDEIDRAAMGHGLLNTEPEGRAVRRIPLAAVVNGVPVPTLAMELFRVASGQASVSVAVGTRGIRDVAVGSLVVPTQGDGSVWLRYTRESRGRLVSAADVLASAIDPATFERKLVLVGVTALGLADRRPIPGGGSRDGVEIHAELIESIFDGAVLARPGWSGWAEAAFLLVAGVIVVAAVPVMRVRAAWIVLLPLLVLDVGGSVVFLQWPHRLLDAGTPGLGLIVLFTVMLSVTLAEAERQRRLLRRQVELQKEAAARFEGELSAARRIQLGILPKPADLLAGERRFSLHIVLEPAREVGGDLYDFFMLDRDRLFFLLGDVSGKGLPGSLFMAVSKSLYKSTALRRGGAVATMMQEANTEISRDNPEALFVTLFAAVLDVNTGALEYCNAGHDRPYLVPRGGGRFTQLAEGGGPPLCVLDDFPYTAATHQLQPGDTLCLITDGVTEARTASGELFSRERLESRLAAIAASAGAEEIATTIGADVAQFVAGAEPADDLAILVLRWDGPPAASGR